MNYKHQNKTMAGLALGLVVLLVQGCGMETDTQNANQAKARSDIKQVLTALDGYKAGKGQLPATLKELQDYDASTRNIDATRYAYSAAGLGVADGTLWLICTTNRFAKGMVVAGRLPPEVTTTFPKVN